MRAVGGLGKSTLVNKVFTEMKTMAVFADSKYVTFGFDSESNDNAVISEVQQWLKRQRGPVLLVLDNAQHQRQLDSILNCSDIKGKGFVMITSRKRDLVAPSDLYDMPIMKHDDALKLFRWHSQGASSSGVLKTHVLKVRCNVQ
jgi:hypothetical protein